MSVLLFMIFCALCAVVYYLDKMSDQLERIQRDLR